MIKKILLPIFLSIGCALYGAQDPTLTSSTIKSVKIYRTGAELAHVARVLLEQGNQELVIRGISNEIELNSLLINCASMVTIMGVEFSTDHLISPEISKRVKQLQDSAASIQHGIDRVSTQIKTTTELIEVLRINRDIKGSQNNLSVAELMRLMDYYKIKSAELHTELEQQKDKQRSLTEKLKKLNHQLTEEESKNMSKSGQITLQLSVASKNEYEFQVSYITPNAYWTPYYDLRVDNIQKPIKLVYRAKISQTTGIDWKKVKLSLSSSVPGRWGSAPVLKQWFLSYINPINVLNKNLAANSIPGFAAESNQEEVAVIGYSSRGIASVRDAREPLYIVNGAIMNSADFKNIHPSAIKSTKMLEGKAASAVYGAQASNGAMVVTMKDGLEDYVSVTDTELDISFDIELPYDVPTNGKEQTATLQEHEVPANFKFYSVPKLDKDAYLLAEIAQWEKLNLLPGDANIIFEGTYVGKSFIDPTSTADTLNLTLGPDKRVAIKKEKMIDYSSVKFLGSNKLQNLTYEITVKNNKKDAVNLIVKDQYPLSSTKEIEVELLDAGGAIVNTETGVLTWKIEVQPGESKKFRFAYSVKFPKDRMVNLR